MSRANNKDLSTEIIKILLRKGEIDLTDVTVETFVIDEQTLLYARDNLVSVGYVKLTDVSELYNDCELLRPFSLNYLGMLKRIFHIRQKLIELTA